MTNARKINAKAEPRPERHMLVADDEPSIRRVLEAIFSKDGYCVHTAENGFHALEIAAKLPISVMITDLIMPDINGIDLLKKVRDLRPEVVAVVITAYGTIKTAVDSIRLGAADYITKPFEVDEIRAIVSRAVARKESGEPAPESVSGGRCAPRALGANVQMIQGDSPAMREVYQLVRRAATSRATVLIRGESGTGKELVARALHTHSDRSSGPFIAVACAALPETLLESELFGHEKNAFTGAMNQRAGRFELADGGTLFLDEIGDISANMQVKLLRVLQERSFERVGAVKTISVDVRVVAATNADLESLVKEGKFRSDLYYRLHVIQITLPPLRERPEDVPVLAAEFLRRYAKENGRKPLTLGEEAGGALKKYRWPGNVRELENVMERCVVMAEPDQAHLNLELLPEWVRNNDPIMS
jgi:DNA-binding NtrC family response regulator